MNPCCAALFRGIAATDLRVIVCSGVALIMGKYTPLETYLRRRRERQSVELTFDDIERIIGALLPNSAQNPDWWSNETTDPRQVQCRSWREAGFRALVLDGEDRVQFVRTTA